MVIKSEPIIFNLPLVITIIIKPSFSQFSWFLIVILISYFIWIDQWVTLTSPGLSSSRIFFIPRNSGTQVQGWELLLSARICKKQPPRSFWRTPPVPGTFSQHSCRSVPGTRKVPDDNARGDFFSLCPMEGCPRLESVTTRSRVSLFMAFHDL